LEPANNQSDIIRAEPVDATGNRHRAQPDKTPITPSGQLPDGPKPDSTA